MAASVLLAAPACSSDPEPAPDGEAADVTLRLNVTVAENLAQDQLSRFSLGEDDTYEPPSSVYEKVRTLRVIIVRGNRIQPGDPDYNQDVDYEHTQAAAGIIEHNRLVTVTQDDKTGAVTPTNDNLDFLVTSGEYKSIYLFANEAALDDALSEALKDVVPTQSGVAPLAKLVPGIAFPTEAMRNATFSRQPDKAWLDNTQLRQDQAPEDDDHVAQLTKSYIPMCERFTNVKVPVPAYGRDEEGNVISDGAHLTKSLFVVRDAIKFSFNIKTATGFKATSKPVRVDQIRIDNLANKSYILPRGAVYSPLKDQPAGENGARKITEFAVPDDAGKSEFNVFLTSIPDEMEEYAPILKPGMDITVVPYLYALETLPSPAYPLTVTVKLSEGVDFHVPVDLGLDKIPRNTHVKINILFGPNTVSATADVVPYKEVWLKPDFGFDPFEVLYLDTYVEELNPGGKLQLNAWVTPESETDYGITWTSSEGRVATVDDKGLVTAIAEGITTITAHTNNGLQASCIVTVK